MSDSIPFDIQLEIIKRLPIRSLLRFRSVSKSWKSLIDSKKFINDHASNHNHPHHLLVRYDDRSKTKYVSVLDNDSFPQHKFPITPPESLKLITRPKLLDSSHGLFCFYNFYEIFRTLGSILNQTAVIWNPSIRKSVDIVVPNVLKWPYKTVLGFGVCPHTLHFKLVKVSYINYPLDAGLHIVTSFPYQVEVFTSSSGWRSPLSINNNNLPAYKYVSFESEQVVIDGFIYWLAYDSTPDGMVPLTSRRYSHLIISFDLTSEKFTEIYLPDGVHHHSEIYDISKLNGSLVLLECNIGRKTSYGVWKMDHVTSKTFSKLYTISTPEESVEIVHGFRKSGEPIIQMKIYSKGWSKKETLFVYEHDSKQIKSIPISGKRYSFSVISYVETLLLLDY